ncbi:MAG: transcription-repair coupling factor [Gammaproteobacteria bacterium]|nr:transcription-repair coupling factor [Gammaproteobacteria bacterium]
MPVNLLTTPPANKPGDRRRWGGLTGGTAALAIANAAREFDGLLLAVTATTSAATRLETELQFFLGSGAENVIPILHLPDWETLPYDLFSPHQDIVSERLQTLCRLPSTRRGILVAPATTLMKRLPPPSYVAGNTFVFRKGDRVNLDALRRTLEQAGYRAADTVYEHGEFAVRGALIDVFPMGAKQPIRLDLFDDEIESLRTFDPDTQRTIEKMAAIELLPAREFPLDKTAIRRFQDAWHLSFDSDPRRCTLYQDVSQGSAQGGIEYYLPLFFERTATLFDYLPSAALVFADGDIHQAAEEFWREATDRYREYCVDPTRPLLPPPALFLTAGELFEAINALPRTDLLTAVLPQKAGNHNFVTAPLPDIAADAKSRTPLAQLENLLAHAGGPVLFCAESAGRREAMLDLLRPLGIAPTPVSGWDEFAASNAPWLIAVHPLERGFVLPDSQRILITETELFGQRVFQRRRRSREREVADQAVKNLTELRPGAPVVHIDHGVGRYLGLQSLAVDGEPQEFLALEYAEGAKLYVPVANLFLISRYSGGDPDAAPLHRLGAETWQKAKEKAAREIRDTAAELLDIHARRAARVGFAYPDPGADYAAFSAGFPFEETPDQEDAITAVRKDLLSAGPMDRLVCGDVGFGKTEVAMRAAFVAVSAGRQVAVLVPTTLLAQQHTQNFRDRFANWPVVIEVISRFRSAREQEAVLQRVATGEVDILIGTHRLIAGDIKYRDLGLVIVDEEHRFGVRQKEKLKALRAEVDILTLTATPIPRTLNMALGGLRDLSIIATPPARRLSVKTFVHQSDPRLVREAVLREILRGGQVYFLHNEVKTIAKIARELAELVPEARVDIAHGQMPEKDLERVMSEFYHRRFNLLVCSTIIETGIDVPSANTIIIERADKLGLAQLHQLRGRVGRSHHQAYAYLLTPHPNQMTDDAHKRLEAIQAADHLGSGFTLATHDLEIRGAGELLGDDQSGHIAAIGFSLYMELLERAVDSLRRGGTAEIDLSARPGAEVNLHIPALIPEAYVPDVHTRLMLYKRLAGAADEAALRELQVEMIDRFGLLPDEVRNLCRVTLLRQRATELGIVKIEAGVEGGLFEFSQSTTVDPLALVHLVQRQPDRYRLRGATTLRFTARAPTADERVQAVEDLLERLTPAREQVA